MRAFYPRLMIAGTSGDSGKTAVTVGLAGAWSRRGRSVAAFKKGPDYIDAAWLSAASGKAARNLDTFLAAPETIKRSFVHHAIPDGINIIEGNRGLHDGFDAEGTHSSAALSKLIKCPVVLVQDVTKMTRSAAAVVLGTRMLDPEVELAGVILNKIAGPRHEKTVRAAIAKYCGIPVFGALPKLPAEAKILSRHLGLITPREERRRNELVERLAEVIENCVDLDRVLAVAQSAPDIAGAGPAEPLFEPDAHRARVRVCYLSDAAFSFYYPENLEALTAAGAELVPVSALEARELPECHALYVGGGFPESHATALADNRLFRESLFRAASSGLPIYAECGGLIYLAENLSIEGTDYPMTGVFPLRIGMNIKPQGHGYVRIRVDDENPFFHHGTEIQGHEFHYSYPLDLAPYDDGFANRGTGTEDLDAVRTVFEVKRGVGCGGGRDGLLRWNVLGTYTHIHALGCPAWASGLVGAADRNRKE